MRTEVATYRLQLYSEFTLDDAAAIAGYLSQLGISHLYSSPLLQAGKASTHGYDVLDHSWVSKELGGEAAFERVSTALRTHDLGLPSRYRAESHDHRREGQCVVVGCV